MSDVETVTAEWTIVILGAWNKSIFHPKWLTDHIFQQKDLTIEVPMQPGLPMRITGDGVLLIPRDDRLILGVTEVNDKLLLRMEEIAAKVLELLPHTPVSKVGLNFGYKTELDETLETRLPSLEPQGLEQAHLRVEARLYKWTCKFDGETINISVEVEGKEVRIKFNFDAPVADANECRAKITGRLMEHRDTTKRMLIDLYGLGREDS